MCAKYDFRLDHKNFRLRFYLYLSGAFSLTTSATALAVGYVNFAQSIGHAGPDESDQSIVQMELGVNRLLLIHFRFAY